MQVPIVVSIAEKVVRVATLTTIWSTLPNVARVVGALRVVPLGATIVRVKNANSPMRFAVCNVSCVVKAICKFYRI